MADKSIRTKDLSQDAKKIKEGKTKRVLKGGLQEECNNINIEIKTYGNRCKVSYNKDLFDLDGNKLDITANTQAIWFKDEPEIYEIELDKDLKEKVGTEVKIKDEDLKLSKLKLEVDKLIDEVIKLVEEIEGYNQII